MCSSDLWPTRLIAVRVAPRLVASEWRTLRLARGAARLLERLGVPFHVPQSTFRVEVVDGLGAGYGHPSPAGERARALAADHGLSLDPTYGAKAFAFLLERAPLKDAAGNMKRVVFWHTFARP